MGRYIIKLSAPDSAAYYMEWSTVVDAPVTAGMTLPEFRKYYRSEYGLMGIDKLSARMARVEQYGSSAIEPMSAAGVIAGNRAGPKESKLTMAEIIDAYCLGLPIRGGWSPFEITFEVVP